MCKAFFYSRLLAQGLRLCGGRLYWISQRMRLDPCPAAEPQLALSLPGTGEQMLMLHRATISLREARRKRVIAMSVSAGLRIRTDPAQIDDVITQIGKGFETTLLEGEISATERLFHITPHKPPKTLPPISAIYFTADDDSPVTPHKLRSLFSNPV